jgi:hypothetical protein
MGWNLQDLTGLVAVIMVFSIVLVPVIGFTARFAFKPIAETLARLLAVRGDEETLNLLERRVALLEQQVDSFEHELVSARQAATFDRQLQGGGSGGDEGPGRATGEVPPGDA